MRIPGLGFDPRDFITKNGGGLAGNQTTFGGPAFGAGPGPQPFGGSVVAPDADEGDSVLSRLGGYFTDKDQGMQRIAMILGGANLASSIYGNYKQGKQEDEERKRNRLAADSQAPIWAQLARTLGGR